MTRRQLARVVAAGTLLLAVSPPFAATAGSMRGSATSSGCTGEWTAVESPNVGGHSNQLNGVAALSPADVWAVGTWAFPTGHVQPLTMHWDGTAWTVVKAPGVTKADTAFEAVWAIAPDDIWGVGTHPARREGRVTPLAEDWDGTAWSIVPTPTVNEGFFVSVSGAATDDVWAVGYKRHHGDHWSQLIAHWDGGAWIPVVGPDPSGDEELLAVQAIASDDVWAVGWHADLYTLTEHWDGTSWSIVDSPNPSHLFNGLFAVAGSASSNVWATGFSTNPSNGYPTAMALHWDGASWTVNSPMNSGDREQELLGVATPSSGSVWAVGYRAVTGRPKTLVEQSDGSTWTVVRSANPLAIDELLAISADSETDAWSVGFKQAPGRTGYRTLVEHYCA